MLGDEQLLSQIAQGKQDAFRVIYDRYFDRLSIYVFKICKVEEITAEIVQDIFLKIWINRENLCEIQSFQPYIFLMARNKTIDYLRKLAKETNLIKILESNKREDYHPIDDQENLADLKLVIEKALFLLSPQKKQIFQMSKIEGYSHDEIGELMNLSKSTVKNHLSETLKHLRNFIVEGNFRLLVMLFIIWRLSEVTHWFFL